MLLENDELLPELSEGRRIDGWREGLVAFAPTYMYRPNSDRFNWHTDAADGAIAGHRKQHCAPSWSDDGTKKKHQFLKLIGHGIEIALL